MRHNVFVPQPLFRLQRMLSTGCAQLRSFVILVNHSVIDALFVSLKEPKDSQTQCHVANMH